ncbi:N-6 DNA methylase (plasmid) [Sphaerotilaceae bacterium SBD11-9]
MASSINGLDEHQRAFVALVRSNSTRHRAHQVFADFCELAALAISNSVDRQQYDAREARYLEVVKKYSADEVKRFPEMLACVVQSLERGISDCLGTLFMGMELGDHWKGQFFTPFPVSQLMAGITLGDAREAIAQQGFITVSEPAAGAGGMVLAMAATLQDQGVNYQQCMHAMTQDIDACAVHMAYIQLSLCHVPAIVVHGNTLAMTEWAHWVTPAHVLGGWDWRLRRRDQAAARGIQLAKAAVPELQEVLLQPAAAPAAAPAPLPAEALRAAVVDQRLEQLSLFG